MAGTSYNNYSEIYAIFDIKNNSFLRKRRGNIGYYVNESVSVNEGRYFLSTNTSFSEGQFGLCFYMWESKKKCNNYIMGIVAGRPLIKTISESLLFSFIIVL